MNYWLAVCFSLICIVVLSKCADAADCAASPREIWSTHPHAHPRWRLRDGAQCWYAGRRSPRLARLDRHRSYGMAVSVPSVIPTPRPRLDWEILHPEQYRRLTPAEGAALWRATGGE